MGKKKRTLALPFFSKQLFPNISAENVGAGKPDDIDILSTNSGSGSPEMVISPQVVQRTGSSLM